MPSQMSKKQKNFFSKKKSHEARTTAKIISRPQRTQFRQLNPRTQKVPLTAKKSKTVPPENYRRIRQRISPNRQHRTTSPTSTTRPQHSLSRQPQYTKNITRKRQTNISSLHKVFQYTNDANERPYKNF